MITKTNYRKYIRERREKECFSVINRGKLWYDRLSREQLSELDSWYQDWLDAPEKGVIPPLPNWVNNKIEKEVEEIFL